MTLATVELHGGPLDGKRADIDARARLLTVPVFDGAGFSEFRYTSTGEFSADGTPVWAPAAASDAGERS